MQETQSDHRRTHSLLLLQRLLSLRGGASPFTLLLDTIEQSSRPLIREYITRARASKSVIIYLSFETLRPPQDVTHFIHGRRKTLAELQKEITALVSPSTPALLIIDTLHPLIALQTLSLPLSSFLTSLLPSPQASLLATFHLSVPFPAPSDPYSPSPLSLLSYLATTLITLAPLHHVLAEKRAEEKARSPPSFGLEEGEEGILLGRGANGGASPAKGGNEIVLKIEHRRKSGRGIYEEFAFAPANTAGKADAKFRLLVEHPLYNPPKAKDAGDGAKEIEEGTFSLTLTDKQRRDREGVVLPYFDAQKGDGPGEGGRILYQMGEEDLGDWDEEEDEI